jgi:pimeloyl-ACP methyl ester carboxylesterase
MTSCPPSSGPAPGARADPARAHALTLPGHSGGVVAHGAADARPDRVARVVYADSGPLINDELPAENGEIPLPDWPLFEQEDLLQLIEDTDAPQAIVGRLLDVVPPGSWLGIAHPARDVIPEVVTMARHLSKRSVTPTTLRTHAEISRFSGGLELLPPGVVQLHRWEPGAAAPQAGRQVPAYCGLARKP